MKTQTITVIFVIAFFVSITLYPGTGFSNFLLLLSAAAAFLFGIFIVFSVSNSQDKLNKINGLLKSENANVLLLYKLAGKFGSKTQDDVRDLLDTYLVDQIDYKLDDFEKSSNSFHKLYEYLISLNPKSKSQEILFEEMVRILTASSKNRIQVQTMVKQKLSSFEWVSICGLTFVVISTLYEMSHGNVFQSLLLTILAGASVLLVLVLKDYDDLKWQKAKWTWQPLHNLFLDLDLIPYYPRPALNDHEAVIPKGARIRVADYPHYYPDVSDKKVSTEQW